MTRALTCEYLEMANTSRGRRARWSAWAGLNSGEDHGGHGRVLAGNFRHHPCARVRRLLVCIADTPFPLACPGPYGCGPASHGEERAVERSPAGRHWRPRGRAPRGKARSRWAIGFLSATISVAAAAGLAFPSAGASAAGNSGSPTLKQLLAEANKLSNQIDVLSQQYDALRIQYTEARQQVKIAWLTVKADQRLLAGERVSIAQIAAAGYMTGGLSPTMQLLQGSDPQALLNRAAILTELQRENGAKINLVTSAKLAALRGRLLAIRE